MIDHHVDRPQVEEGQLSQPSGPNRPIELPFPAPHRPGCPTNTPEPRAAPSRALHTPHHPTSHTQIPSPLICRSDPAWWPGGHREDDTPDPIPNSDVKRTCADGSVHPHARVGHHQAPMYHHHAPAHQAGASCFASDKISRKPRTAAPRPGAPSALRLRCKFRVGLGPGFRIVNRWAMRPYAPAGQVALATSWRLPVRDSAGR